MASPSIQQPSDGPVGSRTVMCIGVFPDFTCGTEMEQLIKPLLTKWGPDVVDKVFPSMGTTCKVTFENPDAMWKAIKDYKSDPAKHKNGSGPDAKDLWVNVHRTVEERKVSNKLKAAMDCLEEIGQGEVIAPRWSKSQCIRATPNEPRGVLCTVEGNDIRWEKFSDSVVSPTQKQQVEQEFAKRVAAM